MDPTAGLAGGWAIRAGKLQAWLVGNAVLRAEGFMACSLNKRPRCCQLTVVFRPSPSCWKQGHPMHTAEVVFSRVGWHENTRAVKCVNSHMGLSLSVPARMFV